MRNLVSRLFNYRLRALIKKEFNQIGRDRRLQISLILPPVLQLTLFGFALSANVTDVRLASSPATIPPSTSSATQSAVAMPMPA